MSKVTILLLYMADIIFFIFKKINKGNQDYSENQTNLIQGSRLEGGNRHTRQQISDTLTNHTITYKETKVNTLEIWTPHIYINSYINLDMIIYGF